MPPNSHQACRLGAGKRLQQCRISRPGADDELANSCLETIFHHTDGLIP